MPHRQYVYFTIRTHIESALNNVVEVDVGIPGLCGEPSWRRPGKSPFATIDFFILPLNYTRGNGHLSVSTHSSEDLCL